MSYDPSQPQPPYTQYPPQQPPPPKKKVNKWLAIGCGGLLVLALAVCAISAAAGSHTTTSTDATVTQATVISDTPVATATLDANVPTAPPVPTQAPAKWTTTHTYSGTGDKQTGTMSVPDDWRILWSCDARNNYGIEGELLVSVYNSDGSPSDSGDLTGTCSTKKVTSDNTEEHQGGDVYLKIFSAVPWTIKIQELK